MDLLSREEYARFMSIVNTNFERFSKDKFYTISLDNKYIAFEVKEFCNYRIVKVGEINEYNY